MSNCSRCRYAGTPNPFGNVHCHRYPPVGSVNIFPLMRAVDWCGEWERAASSQESPAPAVGEAVEEL